MPLEIPTNNLQQEFFLKTKEKNNKLNTNKYLHNNSLNRQKNIINFKKNNKLSNYCITNIHEATHSSL